MLPHLLAVILPRVEDPIPDTIGVGALFTAAGAGGVIAVVAGSVFGASEKQQNWLARVGVSIGFVVGVAVYAISLVGQLL
jgi:hypothetical protein